MGLSSEREWNGIFINSVVIHFPCETYLFFACPAKRTNTRNTQIICSLLVTFPLSLIFFLFLENLKCFLIQAYYVGPVSVSLLLLLLLFLVSTICARHSLVASTCNMNYDEVWKLTVRNELCRWNEKQNKIHERVHNALWNWSWIICQNKYQQHGAVLIKVASGKV